MGALPPLGEAYALGQFKPNPVYEQTFPRAIVKINGQAFILKSYRLSLNAHGDADSVSVVVPIATNPDWSQLFSAAALTANGQSSPIYAEIWAGFPPDGSTSNSTAQLFRRFYGIVDTGSFKHESDNTTFTCRSLAAPLITTKLTTPFTGQSATTTVAFIQQQASRFGLQTNIQLNAKTQPVTMQQVLGAEFVTGVRNWTIWQLMLQCAQMDDVDLWIDENSVLNYQSPALIKRTTYSYVWGKNLLELTPSHATQFSKNIRVEVRSWNKRTRVATVTRVSTSDNGSVATKRTYTRTVTSSPVFGSTEAITQSISSSGAVTTSVSTASGGPASSGFTTPGADSGLERYIFYVQNKTPQQCDDLAQKIWRQISQHEWTLNAKTVVTSADIGMGITALVAISGSPFAIANQKYWPRQISEVFDPVEGFTRDFIAVNHENPLGFDSV